MFKPNSVLVDNKNFICLSKISFFRNRIREFKRIFKKGLVEKAEKKQVFIKKTILYYILQFLSSVFIEFYFKLLIIKLFVGAFKILS